MSIELSEQEIIRRNSLGELRKLGIEPYPAARYEVTAKSSEIIAGYDPEKNNFQDITIAGRIMSRRIMGSASFMELQDSTGRIQVYVRRDDICEGEDTTLYNVVFKKLLDIDKAIAIIRRFMSQYKDELMAVLQNSIAAEVERGTIGEISAFDLIMDIASLNVFPFIVNPIVRNIVRLDEEQYRSFLEDRKREVVRLIMSRLKK